VCIIGSFSVKQICLRVKQGRDGTKASKKDFESQLVNQIAEGRRLDYLTIYRRDSVEEWPFFKLFFLEQNIERYSFWEFFKKIVRQLPALFPTSH
jgi:hypothetical protein